MRIIFLNSWYAMAGKPFDDFISQSSSNTDVFGLSEVSPELFLKLKGLLPKFTSFYDKGMFDKNMSCVYGQAVFVNKGIKVWPLGVINIFKNVWNDVGFASPFKMSISEKCFYILNIHGKARPGHKLDTPARIRQSRKIIEFFKNKAGPKIIGGDFNLMPETRSVKMFEKAGYRNLIKDFNIKETRNRLSWEQFPGDKQHFADCVFVSPEVKVKSFEVPNIEVSDHLPLILDFEV